MKSVIMYTFPSAPLTPKERITIDNISYYELIRDDDNDNFQEIDFDFPYLENFMISTLTRNTMSEHFFTMNCN